MIDDWLLSLLYVAWLTASTMPLGLMLGSPCSPCCDKCPADGKPRTDPKDEGTWVPAGTWRGVGGVTWTFTANPGDESGETWFFYGSGSTSKVGGGATLAEQRDWGNICNWYSNKTTSPSTLTGFPAAFDKRATRLPPVDAVVHIYTSVSTVTAGPQVVKSIYSWSISDLLTSSEITSTAAAHDSDGGAVFNDNADNFGTVNNGAVFNDNAENFRTVNDGATFNDNSRNNNTATVNNGAVFNDNADNFGTVNNGAVFNDNADNFGLGTVNNGAVFNDNADNFGTVNDGATFNDNSRNFEATVNGGATFNDNSRNKNFSTVNGGATFNDAACSERTVGSFFASPCTRKFVAHPTDLPTCNGTAPDGCANFADTCGCG